MSPNEVSRDSALKEASAPQAGAPGKPCSVWSIGIYQGASPLCLAAHPQVSNPVLSARDVSDLEADFVADPFMVNEQGTWYMFFEVMNRKTGRGEIGLAVSHNSLDWEYCRVVIREPFHLSYPYVFKWENDYYMVPETLASNRLQLYKASVFPTEWRQEAILMEGSYTDASLFYFEGKWWMFVCAPPQGHHTLRLYSAAGLKGPWTEHPGNPIVEGDHRMARPAGRVTFWENKPIRFAQDCYPHYGTRVRAFAITELTPRSYREQEVSNSPVLSPTGDGWNSSGMHHVDPHFTGKPGWIACVDGNCRR